MKKKVHFIAANSCWGAQIKSCERGPDTLLKKAELDFDSLYPELFASENELSSDECLPLIYHFNQKLSQSVRAATDQGAFPVVVGGDHSVAVGTWNGVFKNSPFGLLWIDAHMDSHTPSTTPSGAWHGMPLAALLGYGHERMAKLKGDLPILRPENLALIGVRSFEEGEEKLLKELNVRVYYIDEVKRRGMEEVLLEAKERVLKNVDAFGVSLDLDVFDPSCAPGVGSKEENGLFPEEFFPHASLIAKDPRLCALEIVEYNPLLDISGKTLDLSLDLLSSLVPALEQVLIHSAC